MIFPKFIFAIQRCSKLAFASVLFLAGASGLAQTLTMPNPNYVACGSGLSCAQFPASTPGSSQVGALSAGQVKSYAWAVCPNAFTSSGGWASGNRGVGPNNLYTLAQDQQGNLYAYRADGGHTANFQYCAATSSSAVPGIRSPSGKVITGCKYVPGSQASPLQNVISTVCEGIPYTDPCYPQSEGECTWTSKNNCPQTTGPQAAFCMGSDGTFFCGNQKATNTCPQGGTAQATNHIPCKELPGCS